MIKKILFFLTFILLVASSYFIWAFSQKKDLIIPYPYSFNDNAKLEIKDELNSAQSAKILIVGDRMAEALNSYTDELKAELALNFKKAPEIYNWAKTHEGLHRTLFKLKALKVIPPIIIYHGASSELYEKIFSVEDKEAILKNFSVYDNEKIISLIITFPILSKYFYKKTKYYELGSIKEYNNQNFGLDKLSEKEVSFKIFENELHELIDLVKVNKSNLIFITTPINLEIAPKEVCSQSMTNTIVEVQQEIEGLIKEGNYKLAYSNALELSAETNSNAKSFFLLGQASLGNGDLKSAKNALAKAAVFDCSNWRGNAVYNALLKKVSKQRQIPIIDFDQYLSSSLSKEGLFIDEIFPQNIYYHTMMTDLKEILKKFLSVND